MNARCPATALLVAIVVVTVATGCRHDPDMSPAYGYDDPYASSINDPRITVLAQDLRSWLGFQAVTVADDGQAPMTVQVPVRNLSDSYKLIDYRVLFFDRAGLQLEPAMGWRFVSLEPKQIARLTGQARTLDAVDWRLEVKWSR